VRNDYHVVESEGSWWVVLAGKVVGAAQRTQELAITHARSLAHTDWNIKGQQAQIHVHRPNGIIRTEWTYGNDPPQYPG
jgi:hypothetical protein